MYDIITIGSASIDVFVKAKNRIEKHKSHYDIIYRLGEKELVNKINFSTGGDGTNTAVAFSRLGLKTGFIGVLGNDNNGKIILDELKKEKVTFLGKVKQGNTGYSVILPGKSDRAILVYKGVNNQLKMQDIKNADTKWIYASTMLGKSLKTLNKIISRKEAKLVLNFSTYLAKKGVKKLSPLLRRADIIILNRDEAEALTKKRAMEDIFNLLSDYTGATIVITDGFNPIYVYDYGKLIKKKIRKIKPVDSTGAGDAFASGFVYGIIKGKKIETCIDYGYREAAATLKYIGAKDKLLRRL